MAIGTFGAFTQARLAIYAAQTGLNVTGNNISNINTPGYTRQRLDQVSLYAAGSDRYYAKGDIRTGQGALVKSLSQIRSPYLDIRFRTENAKVGYMDAKLEGLNEIATILDEVAKGDVSKGEDGFGILGLYFNKIAEAMRDLTSETGHQEYDNTVRQVAQNLVSTFNAYANKLEKVRQDTVNKIKDDLTDINGYLTSIRSLNEEIRKCEIHGDPALELRDERNRQIDALSELVDINVVYTEEVISGGLTVEKLTIRLDDANPDGHVTTDESLLVDGIFSAQLSFGTPKLNDAYDPNLKPGDAGYQGKYLDKDGNPTDDLRNAEILTGDGNPNYSVMISELENRLGDLQVGVLAHDEVPVELIDLPAGLKFNSVTGKALTEVADQPDTGDKTMTVYTRTLKPGVTANPPADTDYTYTRQVFEQLVTKPVALDDNDLNGKLQAHRELLTEEGEFTHPDVITGVDEGAGGKRGIPYYQKTLDLLARQFAKVMNEANQGYLVYPDGTLVGPKTGTPTELGLTKSADGYYIDDQGNYVGVSAHDPCIFSTDPLSATATDAEKLAYAQKHGYATVADLMNEHGVTDPDTKVTTTNPAPTKVGGVLFSNNPGNDDPENITAATISISNTWQKNHILVRSYTCVPGTTEPASGDSENLLHMMYLLEHQEYDFIPTDLVGDGNASDEVMFNGTLFEMWNDIGDVLGHDQTSTETELKTSYETALEIDTQRDAVSSVDFNDEAMNLMMYAKSYNAACRLMTTIDSVLDKLINNTGMTT